MAPKNDGKRWARDDVKTLRQLARDANVPTERIAKQLGRSVAAVRSEAQREDISLRPRNK